MSSRPQNRVKLLCMASFLDSLRRLDNLVQTNAASRIASPVDAAHDAELGKRARDRLVAREGATSFGAAALADRFDHESARNNDALAPLANLALAAALASDRLGLAAAALRHGGSTKALGALQEQRGGRAEHSGADLEISGGREASDTTSEESAFASLRNLAVSLIQIAVAVIDVLAAKGLLVATRAAHEVRAFHHSSGQHTELVRVTGGFASNVVTLEAALVAVAGVAKAVGGALTADGKSAAFQVAAEIVRQTSRGSISENGSDGLLDFCGSFVGHFCS
mmetsp:Transcript_3409/g.6881  ORF Transcript_3409/g.6881 Transcript_3409/m.6881 type:complete len:281 (+) Transcript_3409:150-992(+)